KQGQAAKLVARGHDLAVRVVEHVALLIGEGQLELPPVANGVANHSDGVKLAVLAQVGHWPATIATRPVGKTTEFSSTWRPAERPRARASGAAQPPARPPKRHRTATCAPARAAPRWFAH